MARLAVGRKFPRAGLAVGWDSAEFGGVRGRESVGVARNGTETGDEGRNRALFFQWRAAVGRSRVAATMADSSSSAVLHQPFGRLVQMLVQNAGLALGRIPHPVHGTTEPNLPLAELMLGHFAVLADKTRGNLSAEEEVLLEQARSGLEQVYRELKAAQA